MSQFIRRSNLPQNKVKALICGTEDKRILDFFSDRNISVIVSCRNADIDPAVASHIDMAAVHLGQNRIILDKAQEELSVTLKALGMDVKLSQRNVSGKYPDDIGLNFALFGNFAAGNFKHIDNNLEKLIENKKRITVNQGYCKCSLLVVSEGAVITDDASIHSAMLANKVDSLLISKGDIALDGHNYGFIGGASGKISKDEIVFFGNIKNHRDYEKIRGFAEKYKCSISCTDNDALRDIGGIIPITEESLNF